MEVSGEALPLLTSLPLLQPIDPPLHPLTSLLLLLDRPTNPRQPQPMTTTVNQLINLQLPGLTLQLQRDPLTSLPQPGLIHQQLELLIILVLLLLLPTQPKLLQHINQHISPLISQATDLLTHLPPPGQPLTTHPRDQPTRQQPPGPTILRPDDQLILPQPPGLHIPPPLGDLLPTNLDNQDTRPEIRMGTLIQFLQTLLFFRRGSLRTDQDLVLEVEVAAVTKPVEVDPTVVISPVEVAAAAVTSPMEAEAAVVTSPVGVVAAVVTRLAEAVAAIVLAEVATNLEAINLTMAIRVRPGHLTQIRPISRHQSWNMADLSLPTPQSHLPRGQTTRNLVMPVPLHQRLNMGSSLLHTTLPQSQSSNSPTTKREATKHPGNQNTTKEAMLPPTSQTSLTRNNPLMSLLLHLRCMTMFLPPLLPMFQPLSSPHQSLLQVATNIPFLLTLCSILRGKERTSRTKR